MPHRFVAVSAGAEEVQRLKLNFHSPQVLQVSTQPEENIPGPPRAVQGHAVGHRQIHVKWEPPLITNGIIAKYRVYYAEVRRVTDNSLN